MLKKYNLLYVAVLYLFIHILITPLQLKAEPPDINPWFKQAVLLKTYQQSYDWRIPWEKGEITTQLVWDWLLVCLNYQKAYYQKITKVKNFTL